MKRYLYLRRKTLNNRNLKLILVLLICTVFLYLQATPVIKFDQDQHNFGEIKEEDGKVQHEFHFQNTGDEPLKIVKVKAS